MELTPVSRKARWLAEAGLLYAAAVWGATFFIVRDLVNAVDPIVLVGYRFLLAGLLLAAYLLIKGESLLKGLRDGIVLGIILWLLYVPQTIGLKYTSAANSGFITGLFVVFVPLLAYFLIRKSPSKWEYLAIALSIVGLWFLTGGINGMNFGDLITLVCAFFYALHLLYCDKYVKAGRDPLVISCQQFIFVGVLSFVTAFILKLPLGVASSNAWGMIVFLTLFPTISAFVIQLFAQKLTSPFRVSLIFTLEPVFAAIFAWTLGGEPFIAQSALGGLLIFVAMIIAELPVAKRPASGDVT